MKEAIKDNPNLVLERYIKICRIQTIIIAMSVMSGTSINSQHGDTVYNSGGSSGTYSGSEETTHIYSASSENNIESTLISLNLENSNDYLYIHNGVSLSFPLSNTLVGTMLPAVITSTKEDIAPRFFSINYNNTYGYMTGDYNMDGKTKYTNPGNDLNYLFSQHFHAQITLHSSLILTL